MASVDTSVGTAMPAAPWSVASGRRLALLGEQAMGVLDRDRRIVDQNADREREPAERHGIERLARENTGRPMT